MCLKKKQYMQVQSLVNIIQPTCSRIQSREAIIAMSSKTNTLKLREQLVEWQKIMETAMLREEKARMEASVLLRERDELKHKLYEETLPRIQKLVDMQQQFVENYAAILPIIEVKKRLAAQVTKLKEVQSEADKVHVEEVSRMMTDLEAARIDGDKKVESAVEEGSNKAKELEAAHKEALAKKDEEIQSVKEDLQKEDVAHKEELSDLRKQNHEEQELLRNRIAQMQQSRSSQAVSNMDLIANKLQATRAEYEAQLQDRDNQLQEKEVQLSLLQEELQTSREALRHQQLLSVVRDVGTRSSKSNATPMPSPMQSPAVDRMCVTPVQEVSKVETSDENDDVDEMTSLCMTSDEEDVSGQPRVRSLPTRKITKGNKRPKTAHSVKVKATKKKARPKTPIRKRQLYRVEKKCLELVHDVCK